MTRTVAVICQLLAFGAVAPAVAAPPSIPRGATIGPSGFATIIFTTPPGTTAVVPASPPPPSPAPPGQRPPPLPMTEDAIIAREQMANPDDKAQRAAQSLDRRLKTSERGNYVGMRVVRDPHARFAFQFRRNPTETLARYTRDPRFASRGGGMTRAELQPTFDLWWKRFTPQRLLGGGGIYEFEGVVRFDMNIDEAEFREIARRERWVIPQRLELRFSRPHNPRSIDPALTRYVRIFARQDREPAITNMALLSGRIILRDGCFRLTESEQGEPLVIFGRDAELGLNAEGYMVLKKPGSTAPRIGERMMWGGPLGFAEADPNVKRLREACGNGPIVAVGEPDSASRSK